jgi:hypothetical protein
MDLVKIIDCHTSGSNISLDEAFLLIEEYVYERTGAYTEELKFQNGNPKHLQQLQMVVAESVKYFTTNRVSLGKAVLRVKSRG